MSRRTVTILALMSIPEIAAAQADTTRRPDPTRSGPPQESARRIRAESRGEVDPRFGRGFTLDLPNYGLTANQAIELQQALARVGCDVGTADGVVGQRTVRGLQCFRAQRPMTVAEVESLLAALNVSFARPPAPVDPPAPERRDTPPALPPVIRPDSKYRPDVIARRDSALRRDSLARDTTTRRDTTARRPLR